MRFYLEGQNRGGQAPAPGSAFIEIVQVALSGGAASDVAYPTGIKNVFAILCDRAQATPNNTDKNFDIASGTGSDTVTCALICLASQQNAEAT